jgi:hypothetical protein
VQRARWEQSDPVRRTEEGSAYISPVRNSFSALQYARFGSSVVGGQSVRERTKPDYCCQKPWLQQHRGWDRVSSCLPSTNHFIPYLTTASTSLTRLEASIHLHPPQSQHSTTLPSFQQQLPSQTKDGLRAESMHDSFIAPSRSSEVSPSASRYASPAPLTCKSQGQQLHEAPLVMRYPGTADRGHTLTIEMKRNKFRTGRYVGLDWKTSCFLPCCSSRRTSAACLPCRSGSTRRLCIRQHMLKWINCR